MPNTLICTVGTSLITNAKSAPDTLFKQFVVNGNIQGTVAELLNLQADNRMCGAEINSICSIVNGKYLTEKNRCVFLVSDSVEGKFIGAVLKEFLSAGKSPLKFSSVDYQVIEGLSDKDIKQFRNIGLRNLVRLIGKETRKTGAKNILINATGGYKAQISFAGMIGQALGIGVAYMHEKFSDVIILPPQPVNLDMTFWLDYGEDFFALNEGTEKSESEYVKRDERFESLIESISENEAVLTTLNATGQLFHETFCETFARKKEDLLPPAAEIAPEDKKRSFEDANGDKHEGLKTYLDRICKESFVISISTNYYNPDLNEGNNFKISSKCRPEQITGAYSNNGKSTEFFITTTATTESERKACLNYLLNNLQNGCY
jgi:putative CRISPR-associated protein (TIGR02619 family)